MPFETMPVLSIDGYMLPQSYAILRYLAKQFGKCKNGLEAICIKIYERSPLCAYRTEFSSVFEFLVPII